MQFIQTVLIQLIQFSLSRGFVYTQLNVKTPSLNVSSLIVKNISISSHSV